MRKKRQLTQLKILREIQCQDARKKLSQSQSQLLLEEQRLGQLEAYQKNYSWHEGSQANGLALCSSQLMAETVAHALTHQRQQVALQESRYRTAKSDYIQEKLQLRTAETLLDRHQKVLDAGKNRQEQKQLDEFSARSWSTQS